MLGGVRPSCWVSNASWSPWWLQGGLVSTLDQIFMAMGWPGKSWWPCIKDQFRGAVLTIWISISHYLRVKRGWMLHKILLVRQFSPLGNCRVIKRTWSLACSGRAKLSVTASISWGVCVEIHGRCLEVSPSWRWGQWKLSQAILVILFPIISPFRERESMMIHLITPSLTLTLSVIPDWLIIISFLNAYFTDPVSLLVLWTLNLPPSTLGLLLPFDALHLSLNRDLTTHDVMYLLQALRTLTSAWRVRVTYFLLHWLTRMIVMGRQCEFGFRGRREIWVECLEGTLLDRGSHGWWMAPNRGQLVEMHFFRGFRRQVGRSHWSLGFFNFKV